MKLGYCTATVIVRSQAFDSELILRVKGDAIHATSHLRSFLMGEIMAKGCEWNNPLAKENFRTNVAEQGLEYAKQALRTDIQHWMAKREGRPVPKWKANVDQEGHLVVDKQRLIDLTGAPLTKEVNSPIPEAVKALVPIELETVRQADKLAQQGAKKIYIPEHAPGGIHFITVYTQSTDNPREYIGSQIDLGENVTWEQAKKRIQEFIGVESSKMHQSPMHKEAFVFVANTNVGDGYQRSVVDVLANEAMVTSRKVLTDVTSTAVSVGVFAMETLRRRRAQQRLEANESKKKKVVKKEKTKEDSPFYMSERRKQVKSNKKEMRNMIKVLTISHFAAETGVGVGGALFVLQQSIGREKRIEKKVKQKKNIEKKYRSMKKKEKEIASGTVLENKEKKRKRRIKMRERPLFKGKYTKEKKRKRRQKRMLGEMLGKKTLREEQKRVLHGKERKRKEKKQKHIREITFSKKEVTLWKTLLRLGRKLAERKPNREKKSAESTVRSDKKLAQTETRLVRVKEKKRIVIKFVFAWILWTFLRKFEFKHSPLKHSFKKEKKTAHLVKKEPSQWVLLAIIWYLAMIRESRGAGSGFARQTHLKKQVTSSAPTYQIPSQAVIFVSAS